MPLARRSPNRSDERGMMIVQVVIVSAVLLAVLLAGFKTVQTTIQAANTTATSAAFKDLVLAVEQNLAVSEKCYVRLGFPPAQHYIPVSAATDGFEVQVNSPDPSLPPIAKKEGSPGAGPAAAEFRIAEVRIRDVNPLGWGATSGVPPAGSGTQVMEKMGANLVIRAERRGHFFGGSTMTAQIPLLLVVETVAGIQIIKGCTTRSIFRVVLGPPNANLPASLPADWVRKSGLECIDRGGTSVREPTGLDWFVCRLPTSSQLSCSNIPPQTDLPGWVCHIPTAIDLVSRTGVTYAY